jgi:hypothetical protein
MNAITQILEKCDQVFENAWQKERQRIEPILKRYQEAKAKNEENEYDINKYINECVYAVTGDKTRNYNNINKKTYNVVNSLKPLMVKSSRLGITEALNSIEATYKESVLHKLKTAIQKEKYAVLTETTVKSVNVGTHAVGFTIRAVLENDAVFTTDCIEAGGYNIQIFHYRYISKLT